MQNSLGPYISFLLAILYSASHESMLSIDFPNIVLKSLGSMSESVTVENMDPLCKAFGASNKDSFDIFFLRRCAAFHVRDQSILLKEYWSILMIKTCI